MIPETDLNKWSFYAYASLCLIWLEASKVLLRGYARAADRSRPAAILGV